MKVFHKNVFILSNKWESKDAGILENAVNCMFKNWESLKVRSPFFS